RSSQENLPSTKSQNLSPLHRLLRPQSPIPAPRHKRFFSSASQNQYTHVSIISSICQRITQLFHRLPVQRIQHLRPVKCDPRNRIALLVNQILKRHRHSSLIFSDLLCALCASCLCDPALEFPRKRLRGITVIIKSPSALPSIPSRQYHSFQQRRRRKSPFLIFVIHNLRNVIRRIQPHKIQQCQRSHRMPASQLHRIINVLDRPHALFERANRVQ